MQYYKININFATLYLFIRIDAKSKSKNGYGTGIIHNPTSGTLQTVTVAYANNKIILSTGISIEENTAPTIAKENYTTELTALLSKYLSL